MLEAFRENMSTSEGTEILQFNQGLLGFILEVECFGINKNAMEMDIN